MRRKYYILFFIFIFFLFPFRVFAFESGYDISFPQCDGDFPSLSGGFAVVGVNHGKAFTFNNCLFDEYGWAKKAKAKISVYLNLNYPSGDTIAFGKFGCRKNDEYCHAYTYGYQSAESSSKYAKSQFIFPDMWWFDVETENTWSDNLVLNRFVLQGAIDFFSADNTTVGIYSTKRSWEIIMGENFVPKENFLYVIPNWIGTGQSDEDSAAAFCFTPFSPTSPVWIVQSLGEFDEDYGCE